MNENQAGEKNAGTRRDFLTAAAGTALAANMGLLGNVHAAGSDIIKIGVIGCGGRGSGAADNVLHAAPNLQIVALGDVFKFRVQGLRDHLVKTAKSEAVKKLGNAVELPQERCFAGLDCHDKVLQSGVDYVILASPPGFRPLHLQAAVAAGKHIFTEKPVGVDGPGIRKVLAVYEDALKKNLCIVAGTQRRHQLGYIETMKQIHQGAIGDITALRCYWNGGNIWFRKRDELVQRGEKATDLAYQLHNWYHFVWTCGDHICEQHVHNLDVCNWAMGTHPLRALGMGSRLARQVGNPNEVGQIYDNFAVDYEYDKGVHMLGMCRQVPRCDGNFPGIDGVSEALTGTKGACQVNAYTINGKKIPLTGKEINPYVQEHSDLIASIRGGKPINELKTVAESTLTAIMGRMSAYTGKAVTWDKALDSKEDTMPAKLDWDMSLPVADVAIPGKTPLV